jgi:hypothetical protein
MPASRQGNRCDRNWPLVENPQEGIPYSLAGFFGAEWQPSGGQARGEPMIKTLPGRGKYAIGVASRPWRGSKVHLSTQGVGQVGNKDIRKEKKKPKQTKDTKKPPTQNKFGGARPTG